MKNKLFLSLSVLTMAITSFGVKASEGQVVNDTTSEVTTPVVSVISAEEFNAANAKVSYLESMLAEAQQAATAATLAGANTAAELQKTVEALKADLAQANKTLWEKTKDFSSSTYEAMTWENAKALPGKTWEVTKALPGQTWEAMTSAGSSVKSGASTAWDATSKFTVDSYNGTVDYVKAEPVKAGLIVTGSAAVIGALVYYRNEIKSLFGFGEAAKVTPVEEVKAAPVKRGRGVVAKTPAKRVINRRK